MSKILQQYTLQGSGYMPLLPVSLSYRGKLTEYFPFLVDSGALFSFAPKELLEDIYPEINGLPEKPSGCRDVHGKTIGGTPLVVELVTNGLPPIKEEVWFSTGTKLILLGESLFEQLEARFRNFAPDRHFELTLK